MIKALLRQQSFVRHLVLGFVITSVLPLSSLAFLNLNNFYDALKQTVIDNMAFIADKKADKINHYVDDSRAQIRSLSYIPNVLNLFKELQKSYYSNGIQSVQFKAAEAKARNLFDGLTHDYDYYDLLLIDNTGEVIFSLKKESEFATNVLKGRYKNTVLTKSFTQTMDFLSTEFSPFTEYEPSNEKSASFTTAPLLKNGLPIGVIAAQKNLEQYLPIIMDKTGLGETGEALLSKQTDNMAFSMTPLRYTASQGYQIPITQAPSPMRFALNGERGQAITRDYAGRLVIAAWRYLPDLHWGMVVKMDVQEAFNQYFELRFYTFVALGFVLFIVTGFSILIGRAILSPVRKLIVVTNRIARGDLNQRIPENRHDEFGKLARVFNQMAKQIQQGYNELEKRVEIRTFELNAAKEAAEMALSELEIAQDNLVQAEKMAALGGLVAGVAHEINTPIGITLTSATLLNTKTQKVAALYEEGELEEDELTAYFNVAKQSAQLITMNTQRAADLIHSFKQVAVDQTSSECREFDLKRYIEEVLLSLNPAIKKTNIQIKLDCPQNLIVNTYAGAFSQILTNFVMNSLKHGYEENENGVLSILVKQLDNDTVELTYADDGKGIPKELQAKVFDPFFTTKRSSGGSGLGLHIVYNLVHQTLKGNLTLSSNENGTIFTIIFPHFLA